MNETTNRKTLDPRRRHIPQMFVGVPEFANIFLFLIPPLLFHAFSAE
jgi:hypothetical protein